MRTAAFSSMRRIWMTIAMSVAVLAWYPAFTGSTSWWLFGIALTVFLVLLLEPLLLTWELRKSGDPLQITDEGVLRRLGPGKSEYVRWSDLREVSIALTLGQDFAEEYFYVLAGPGGSGVIVSRELAAKHDLLSHLAKLPGFDHRQVTAAMGSPVNQSYVVWRARPLEGVAQYIPSNRLEGSSRTLH